MMAPLQLTGARRAAATTLAAAITLACLASATQVSPGAPPPTDIGVVCTTTSPYVGIATTVTDYDAFVSSLELAYGAVPTDHDGPEAVVHTTTMDVDGVGAVTVYGYYDQDKLASAGFSFVSGIMTYTEPCPTATLPPSPTGSVCSPHGDHWHCTPSTTYQDPIPASTGSSGGAATTAPPAPTETCEPHDDHWHCPPGVPEPTTPPTPPAGEYSTRLPFTVDACLLDADGHWHCPGGVTMPTIQPPPPAGDGATTPTAACEPHDDHWHCPPGVPEPSTPPTTLITAQAYPTGRSNTAPPAEHIATAGSPGPVSPASGSTLFVLLGLVGITTLAML